jgi:threonine dehydrogenase-like Zn-dependent dehydrogenase
MRALVYEGARKVPMRAMPEPRAGHDEVLLTVTAVGVCGSDIGLFRGAHPNLPLPIIPGHEFGGRTEAGDAVVVNPMVGCGRCPICQSGRTHLCAQRGIIGFTRPGAYAQRIAVPARCVVPAPGLTPIQAALVEPIANGMHAWMRAGRPTGRVAVIGAGAIGMSLLHVLRSQGLSDITIIDPIPERREAAARAGAAFTADRLSGSFEVVFDAAGTAGTRADAIACTEPGGTVALLGLHDDILNVPARLLITADRTVCGCFAYSEQDFAQAVVLAAQLEAPWAELIVPEQAEAALADLIEGRGPPGRIKTVLQFGD